MKKLFSMMMAVLMVLAMAACGSEPSANGGNDSPEATTVKIGGIGPMTGPYANYGLSENTAPSSLSRRSTKQAASPASRSN